MVTLPDLPLAVVIVYGMAVLGVVLAALMVLKDASTSAGRDADYN